MLEGESREAAKRAMRLLERQDRTEKQLTDKLQSDGYSDEAVSEALDYVKSYHYLDDERFCCNYIRYRQERKSKMQLKTALLQKGINTELINQAMEDEFKYPERSQIRHLIEQKRYNPQEASKEETNKLMGFLFRKGYRIEDIKGELEDIKRELLDITIKKV